MQSPRKPVQGPRNTSARVGALSLALAALLLAIGFAQEDPPPRARAAEWELFEPRPVDDGVPAEVERWEALSCAECHTEIAREWAGSRHGLAWIDPHYQKALSKMRRPESCHGCHVPEPLHVPAVDDAAELPQKPAPRERRRHHGVDCRTCHEGPDDVMLGPRGTPTLAHETARSPSFTAEGANRLCIACPATHIGPVVGLAKDFNAGEPARAGYSCIGCHMAPVERSMAHDPAEDGPSPLRKGRSHALQTPRDPGFLRQAFALSAVQRGERTVVRVENRAGHRVPGLEGRELEFHIVGSDAGAGEPAEARFVLTKESYLPVGAPLEVVLPRRVERVRVRGVHRAPGFAAPVEFLALELVPED